MISGLRLPPVRAVLLPGADSSRPEGRTGDHPDEHFRHRLSRHRHGQPQVHCRLHPRIKVKR